MIDEYIRHLTHELTLHNADRQSNRKLRLRVAIHHGAAVGAALGVAGDGAVQVVRLLDSPQAHEALDSGIGDVAVIISETVFQTSVAPRYTTLDPGWFRRVWVSNKGFESWAYVYSPRRVGDPTPSQDGDSRQLGDDGSSDRPDDGPSDGPSDGAGDGPRKGPGGSPGAGPESKTVRNRVDVIKAHKVVFGFEAPNHD